MRIVIASDSFKETGSAEEVCAAMAEGVRRALPSAEICLVPMADGGEGTVDALVSATGGRHVSVVVADPLGRPVEATYGLLGSGHTAVIEMAAASGLPLVPPELRDPKVTTTYGTGELMRHAIEGGATKLILGLGGSATNDGGAGIGQALGYALTDKDGHELARGGLALQDLSVIDSSQKLAALDEVEVVAACDVDVVLCGAGGASLIFGPQKGATPEDVELLDRALGHYGALVEKTFGISILEIPGGGAAGGLGAGLIAFAGAELQAGVDVVAKANGLARSMEGAGLVLTGEGRLDGQTLHGKAPLGVARLASERDIPVLAFGGALGEGYEGLYEAGIVSIHTVTPEGMPLSEAKRALKTLIADTVEREVRNWLRDAPEDVAERSRP